MNEGAIVWMCVEIYGYQIDQREPVMCSKVPLYVCGITRKLVQSSQSDRGPMSTGDGRPADMDLRRP